MRGVVGWWRADLRFAFQRQVRQMHKTQQVQGFIFAHAVIVITRDECTFNVYDGGRFIWTDEEHNPIQKKGTGPGLHVSELLTTVGRLGRGSPCEILKCQVDVW